MYALSLATSAFTHTHFPTLTSLKVYCTSEFLEGLVSTGRLGIPAREDGGKVPRSNEPVSNISGLPRFISRIETFEKCDRADIHILYKDAQFVFSLQTSSVLDAELSLIFKRMETPGSAEDLTPVVCSSLPPLSRFKSLTLRERRNPIFPTRGADSDTPMFCTHLLP